jgi:thymidylate synthase ThyX
MKTSVNIIADTVGVAGARITSFELTFPRYLLAELNTHKTLAKSCASSRAIPVTKRIQMIEDSPFIPSVFGKNRPGMQSTEDLDETATEMALDLWKRGIKSAVAVARELDKLGVHKQQANRILEPYTYVTDIVTGTEWANFFWLRNSKDADPEFHHMAKMMQEAYEKNTPKQWKYHLPYCDGLVFDPDKIDELFMISGARCARTSYKTFDGKLSTVEEDVSLCKDKLIPSGHLSPFEHAAEADSVYWTTPVAALERGGYYWKNPSDHRHLYGWIPYRVKVEKQLGMICKRDSHAQIEELK